MGLPQSEVDRRVHEALHAVGLAEAASRPGQHLSFGQRKRVALATVLVDVAGRARARRADEQPRPAGAAPDDRAARRARRARCSSRRTTWTSPRSCATGRSSSTAAASSPTVRRASCSPTRRCSTAHGLELPHVAACSRGMTVLRWLRMKRDPAPPAGCDARRTGSARPAAACSTTPRSPTADVRARRAARPRRARAAPSPPSACAGSTRASARYHGEGENEIVVILVAAFLEAILEDIIDRILVGHGADLPVRRAVLDTQRAIGGAHRRSSSRSSPATSSRTSPPSSASATSRTAGARCARRATRSSTTRRSTARARRSTRTMAAQAMQLLDQALPAVRRDEQPVRRRRTDAGERA